MRFEFSSCCCFSSRSTGSPHASLSIRSLADRSDVKSAYEDFQDARSVITNFSAPSSNHEMHFGRHSLSATQSLELYQDQSPQENFPIPPLSRLITRRSSVSHSAVSSIPRPESSSQHENPLTSQQIARQDVEGKRSIKNVARRTSTSLSARLLSSLFHRNSLDPKPSLKPDLPPWVPASPLRFIDVPGTRRRFIPIPDSPPLLGYWVKCPKRSTKQRPMPIDVMLKANWLARRAHESISGIKLGESKTHLTVKCRITLAGVSTLYGESYAKDGSSTSSRLRRDLRGGRAVFKAFYLDCESGANTLVLLMETSDLYGNNDFYGEEEVTLLDPNTILFNQHCLDIKTKATATQIFYGDRGSSGLA